MSRPLTNFEFELLFMALRYAIGRNTIACTMLPPDVIKHYYNRLTDNECKAIVEDMDRFEKEYSRFGDFITQPAWEKFRAALRRSEHKTTLTKDGNFYITFDANGRKYPLEEYVNNPHAEIYIDLDSIQESKPITEIITA